ncbi:MAG: 3-hydroxyacyl-ACP dehydratase FabZ [Myxococcota bacterium]
MSILDFEQIRGYLPHRYPFLFVDTVEAFEADKSLHGRKLVSGNEAFFEGHFPGNPVLPGVIQIEAMAQAGALLAVLSGLEMSKDESFYVGGINDCKFRRPVRPGDVLDLHAELLRKRLGTFKLACRCEVGGQVVSQATLTATSGPALPSPELPEGFPAPIF